MKTQWYSPENPPDDLRTVLIAFIVKNSPEYEAMSTGRYHADADPKHQWFIATHPNSKTKVVAWAELPGFSEEE